PARVDRDPRDVDVERPRDGADVGAFDQRTEAHHGIAAPRSTRSSRASRRSSERGLPGRGSWFTTYPEPLARTSHPSSWARAIAPRIERPMKRGMPSAGMSGTGNASPIWTPGAAGSGSG